MKSLVTKINESMSEVKHVSTIKAEDRDETLLNVKANSYEEVVEAFAKYFGVKSYKITNCKNSDKAFKQGPKYYTKDGYKVNKYVQFSIGNVKPQNARFTISQHGNKTAIQIIYYSNNRADDYAWVYGIYDGDKYKYGEDTISNWLQGLDKRKKSVEYHKYLKY